MNPADICRECEIERRCGELSVEVVSAWEENRALKEAGDILSELASDLICEREISITDIFRLENAVDNWHKAKGEAE